MLFMHFQTVEQHNAILAAGGVEVLGQKLEVFEAKDAVQHNIVHVHCDAHNVVFKALQKEYPKMKVLTFHPSNHCGIAGFKTEEDAREVLEGSPTHVDKTFHGCPVTFRKGRDPKEGQLFVVINVHKFFDGVLQPIVNMDFDLRGQNPEWRIRLRDRESFSKMIARRRIEFKGLGITVPLRAEK
mmetsp:Transcript_14974/g.24024  ORF Transcript_14974/g.24024 Transcript_14974/m.24024 type:complete len:184 (+) Transcript_14974:2-553(+)|eukprot:CAMPEP_0174384984 /NCGR_PEP_ID=MMETSP0811_2-20130205/126287_1 /TAXON_ID=73025 ORGANISM="Eutreptiella gymnastica-like, Strain CCMP1594" /NCGR_SAMPLE_ID=MMETSP0811_2 /ASSEMBLY_ACC=CAM_ASM_000667 /LENGTH=183 /DNA_ID=CAMNT_0015539129 /DNA_START=1 /DNA_END=552 /DNA_ORIENTATION=+